MRSSAARTLRKLGFLVYMSSALAACATQPRLTRTPDGKPDLNGIWQALNTAHYDIEAHQARPALAMRPGPVIPVPAREVVALGAVGSVPAGVGVVVGGAIPYTPEGLAKKKENQDSWLTRDPEIKCYLPGVPRATYMPFPFQIVQGTDRIMIIYEYAAAARTIVLHHPVLLAGDTEVGQMIGRLVEVLERRNPSATTRADCD